MIQVVWWVLQRVSALCCALHARSPVKIFLTIGKMLQRPQGEFDVYHKVVGSANSTSVGYMVFSGD
jgi:hypothetical protein